MDIPATPRLYETPRYDFSLPPPLSEEQEMYFIIKSQHESMRRKDREIAMLTERIMILQRLLMDHKIIVTPLERWRE